MTEQTSLVFCKLARAWCLSFPVHIFVSPMCFTYFSGINEEDLQKALKESKNLIEDEDGSLQAALALSLQGTAILFC